MAKAKTATPPPTQDVYLDQIAKLEAQWKRALADYQNLEKRTAVEKQQFVKLANLSLITQLLPVLDDLERADKHLNDPGLTLIYKRLKEVLEGEGITEIEALNQPFDPNKMECVEKGEGQDDMVNRVDTKGYKLGEIVIRPARVAVGIKS